jgi:hypothetical protein
MIYIVLRCRASCVVQKGRKAAEPHAPPITKRRTRKLLTNRNALWLAEKYLILAKLEKYQPALFVLIS